MAGFCTLCSHHVDSFDGLTACPKCGHNGVPCADDQQLQHVTINKHELRILGIWAENYAHSVKDKPGNEHMPDIVYAIAARLKRNNPILKKVQLTMADEFEALRSAGYDFQTNHPANEGNNPL